LGGSDDIINSSYPFFAALNPHDERRRQSFFATLMTGSGAGQQRTNNVDVMPQTDPPKTGDKTRRGYGSRKGLKRRAIGESDAGPAKRYVLTKVFVIFTVRREK